MALPYDGTPPPEDQSIAGPSEPSGLDRPLDDYVVAPEPVPEHVQSLMGRMSRGKVYLLEETPAILHVDGEERIRGDPRIAALSATLDSQDPTSWLIAASSSSPSPIRPNALFVRSETIKHLSTSKVFSWATGLGATAMGIEWLNDEALLLLFSSAAGAILGLSLLAKAGFDPSEGDDPLEERSAHTIPLSLLPQAELDPKDSLVGTELLTDKAPQDGVKRKGRGNFASEGNGRFDLPALASGTDITQEWNLADGVDPNARIAIRYAVEADGGLRKEAKASEWYKRHGRTAGKETSSARRGRDEPEAFSFQGRDSGEGRDFAKRIGRERGTPYNRPRDRPKKTADDLDVELERMARRRTGGEEGDDSMDVDEDVGQSRRGGGGRRRERRGKEDLDKELEDLFAARTAS